MCIRDSYWMFEQSVEHTEAFFDIKFGKKPAIASANKMVLRAGYNYAANVHALEMCIRDRFNPVGCSGG